MLGRRNSSILNEVLSITAQEFAVVFCCYPYLTHILNEVLSITAQEFAELSSSVQKAFYPQ